MRERAKVLYPVLIRQRVRAIGVLVVASLVTSPMAAVSIRYAATDLPDTIPGEDLWRYEYALDAFPYDAGYGFSIGFDPAATTHLEGDPATPDPAWDVISLQPDPLIPAEGLFDALALVDSPPVAMLFEVTFVWTGASPPGPQPFVVYDPGFGTVEEGVTVVPEPDTGVLFSVGLTLVATCYRRSRRSSAMEGGGGP